MSEVTTERPVVVNRYKSFHGGMPHGVYGLVFIGAAVYYIQQSTTLVGGIIGVLKALVWPAMLIYKVFTMLHM